MIASARSTRWRAAGRCRRRLARSRSTRAPSRRSSGTRGHPAPAATSPHDIRCDDRALVVIRYGQQHVAGLSALEQHDAASASDSRSATAPCPPYARSDAIGARLRADTTALKTACVPSPDGRRDVAVRQLKWRAQHHVPEPLVLVEQVLQRIEPCVSCVRKGAQHALADASGSSTRSVALADARDAHGLDLHALHLGHGDAVAVERSRVSPSRGMWPSWSSTNPATVS